jgi:hypothetical protein
MIDLAVYDRVEAVFDPNRGSSDESNSHEEELHEKDLGTLWFSVRIVDGAEGSHLQASNPVFIYTDCYTKLLKLSKFDRPTAQFPSLVSFIGQTGAGKSTLIVCPQNFLLC